MPDINYVNVDDGYFGKRDDNGIMHTHEQRFPNGMKPIGGLRSRPGNESRSLHRCG